MVLPRPILFSIIGLFFCCTLAAQNDNAPNPLTVAEASDFKSTSTSQEVVDFVNSCANRAAHVERFVFGKTVEGRDMVGVSISSSPYQAGRNDGKTVVLVIGNIHSGECAGKEAILMMIRELADNPQHEWLKNMILLFVPNYNADANDRMGKNNRPGQIGPENGMGRRENAQDLDLNRDFVKIESPEARAMVRLIDSTNPHLFIDCHTTNGSKHQYALTYDVPHNPATAEPIRNYLRQKMMPAVTKNLADEGTLTFYYGNFNRGQTSWTTYGHEPRYSTEYVGLRGRLAILSEAYSYISYKDRILATRNFVTECLNYVNANSQTVQRLLDTVDQDLEKIANQLPAKESVSLNARAVKFDKKVMIKGYQGDEPHDYECDFVGDYESTRSVALPYAYLIPRDYPRQVDRLLMHGITVEELQADQEIKVSVNRISELNKNERAFQKHRMVQATSQQREETISFPQGTWLVRTAQPLGRLLTYMLECESDDGLLFWNFFDSVIAVDKDYPVYRIDAPMNIKSNKIDEVTRSNKITLDTIGGSQSPWSSPSAPRWASDTEIEMELYGRRFLMNAQTLSFSQRLQPMYNEADLAELLASKGLDEQAAMDLAKVKPLESKDRETLVFDGNEHDCIYFADKKDAVILGSADNSGELFDFSPDQSKLAFVNDDGLNVFDLASRQLQTLPVAHSDELIGKLDWVYQEELYGRGNFKGFWWSPDSRHVAFLKLDETKVGKFTITDHIPVRGKDEILSYPKAGDPNPIVAIGMAAAGNLASPQWIDLTKYGDQILISNVDWQPDGQRLIFQVQNRVQTYLDLVSADMQGNYNVLFRDQTQAWIESPGNPKWLPDGRFVWPSPRNGYKHLYLYDGKGSLQKQLTTGEWEVRSIEAFDSDNGVVYFSSAKVSPHQMHVFRLISHRESWIKLQPAAGPIGPRSMNLPHISSIR